MKSQEGTLKGGSFWVFIPVVLHMHIPRHMRGMQPICHFLRYLDPDS